MAVKPVLRDMTPTRVGVLKGKIWEDLRYREKIGVNKFKNLLIFYLPRANNL